MKQAITIDGEQYEVDRVVAAAIFEAAEEIETLRSVLRRLASIFGETPCWCQCYGFKHSKACRDAQRLKIWPRRPAGEVYADTYSQLDTLPVGEWLLVKFKTTKAAFNFRLACVKHRTRHIEAKQRGETVYARNSVATQ